MHVGQVHEFSGNREKAAEFYSKALSLMIFLLMEGPSLIINPPFSLTNSDRYRLQTYIHVLKSRQNHSRSLKMVHPKCGGQQSQTWYQKEAVMLIFEFCSPAIYFYNFFPYSNPFMDLWPLEGLIRPSELIDRLFPLMGWNKVILVLRWVIVANIYYYLEIHFFFFYGIKGTYQQEPGTHQREYSKLFFSSLKLLTALFRY